MENTDFNQMLQEFKDYGKNSFSQTDEAIIEDLSCDITENISEYSDKLEKEQILESTLIALDNHNIIPSGSTSQMIRIVEALQKKEAEKKSNLYWLEKDYQPNSVTMVTNH